jgi:hypothetical protein
VCVITLLGSWRQSDCLKLIRVQFLFHIVVVVTPLEQENWNFVLRSCLLVFHPLRLQMIQLGFGKHARDLLNAHVDPVVLKEFSYLTHVKCVRSVFVKC